MKILLTNDDGIIAPGLQTLFHCVNQTFGDVAEIIVIAPDQGRSECGHSVTTGRPLKVQTNRVGWLAVDGTPVDCVRAALASLAPEVDMVISGVNAGANLGVDLLVSGTFAAAREAAIHGIAAMAVSQYRRPDVPVSWDHVADWLSKPLTDFSSAHQQALDKNHPLLWNVNLPALGAGSPTPPQVRCAVDSSPMVRTGRSQGAELHFESDFQSRPRKTGFDVDLCFSGQITISELSPRVT